MTVPSKEILVAALQAQKQQGASPQRAVANLGVQPGTPAHFDWSQVGAALLTSALQAVYADSLSALDVAIILRTLEYPVGDIALALHANFTQLLALDVGVTLLNPQVWPTTGRAALTSALTGAGFQAEQCELAANILYPIELAVQSNQAWQSSGLIVSGTQTTSIAYQSGQWSSSPMTGYCTGTGNASLIAQPGYTLQGAPEAALIGRVGGQMFMTGNSVTVPAKLSGLLELCINDDLFGRYGAGLTDNRGSLAIKVTTSA